MKRYGNLYAHICDIDNLRRAAHNAARGKRKRDEVTAFFADLDANLEQLHRELTEKRYRTSRYDVFIKQEGKRREIYKLPFRDRVVHWAIMQVLEPIWTPQFTADTHACIKGARYALAAAKAARGPEGRPGGDGVLSETGRAQVLPKHRPRENENRGQA